MRVTSETEPAAPTSAWRITLCGDIGVVRNGAPIGRSLPARQGRLLFAYLALNRHRAVTRDELIDVVWPAHAPASPEAVLSTLLTRLRRVLGDDAVQASRASVSLTLGGQPWVDVESAEQTFAEAQAAFLAGAQRRAIDLAAEAARLLAAPLLAEFDAPWISQRAHELEETRLLALELVAQAALAQRPADIPRAQHASLLLTQLAPFRESGYDVLMRCHAARGDPVEALRAFDGLRTLLRDEFGTTPSPALVALNERLLRHESVAAETTTPTACRSAPPAVPLPALIGAASVRPLVGREDAMATLRRQWTSRPALALLGGEPGIGKTHLAAHLALEVHAGGGTVLYGRCDEDALAPYQPFREMLGQYLGAVDLPVLRHRLPAEIAELVRLVPQLDVEVTGAPGPEGDRQRLFEAVGAVLRDAAEAAPLLIVLDDLHWADKPTLLLVRHVLRALLESPAMVLGTFRDVDAPPDDDLVDLFAGLRRERSFERIAMTGFDVRETEALLRASQLPGGTRFIRRLHELTGGNPFFLAETLRSLGPGATAENLRGLGVPQGVKEVIVRRIARLSRPAAETLAVAAVAGPLFGFEVVRAVRGCAEDELMDAIEELLRGGVISEVPGTVDRFTFAHELVRETQYAQISTSRRARLHGRIARELGRQGGAPAGELAHHVFQARWLLGGETAFEHSIAAAHEASAALAHEQAAEHYDRALVALDLCSGMTDERRCLTLLDAASACERVHDIAASRERFARAATVARRLDRPELLARAACGFGRWQRYGVVDHTAITLLEEALDALPPRAGPLRARTLGALAARLDPRVAQDRRDQLFAEALAMARGLEETETLRALLRAGPDVVCRPDSAHERLSLALEASPEHCRDTNRERVAWATMNRFLALLELGRIGEADDALAQYAGLIAELRQPWFDWHLLTVRATRAALDGDFARAADYAHGARQLELDADPGAVETWAAQTFMIGRGRGRFTEVDEEALRRCAERHEHRPLWRALGARLALGLGREHEARRAFATCVRAGLSDLAPDNEWLATVAMLAETAAGLGDRRNAATLLAALSPYAARTVVVCRGWATWGPVSSFLTRAEST